MRALLTADLRSLGNLAVHRQGRRVLIGAALSLGFLFLVADTFGRMLAANPGAFWVDGLAEPPPMRPLLGMALSPGLLLATWFSFSGGPRQLFELPQLHLWLAAPVRGPVVLLASWLRFGLLVAVWCGAVCGPLALHLVTVSGHSLTWWQVALASGLLALPATAFVMALQVVLVRFFSGRWTRVLFAMLSALGSVTFSVLLLAGALGREDAAVSVVEMTRGRRIYPAVIDAPAHLLSSFAGGDPLAPALRDAGLLLLVAAATLTVIGLLYRRAWANSQRAVAPLRRKAAARPWPASAAAVVFRKELAQLAQQPGQLVGLLVSTLFVVTLASTRLFGRDLFAGEYLNEDERSVFVLLATWLIAQVTIVPGSVLRVALLDGAQWSLYVLAPSSRRAILAGKLGVIALLQTWPALVAAVVGYVQLEFSVTALFAFAVLVPVAVSWSAGVSTLVGTLPGLIRPGPDRNPVLALVAVALAIMLLQLSAIPGGIAWVWLAGYHAGQGPLSHMSPTGCYVALIGMAWALGLLAAGLTVGLSIRQLGRLTRPER